VAAVRCAVRESLEELKPGLVLVACSGGADSVALAAATAFEAPRLGFRIGGVSIDHRLQEGSARRAAEVVALLSTLGFDPVEAAAVDVPPGKAGPEAAARTVRYAAIDAVADRLGAITVLLGHTLNDQAETVLLGLARGSGTRSLAGMASTQAAGRYRRPLLDVTRAITRAACADLGLAVWDDPHNVDPTFARVRVRTDVLPVLETALGPGIAEALARTAALARDDADALDSWAARSYAEVAGPDGSLDVAALAELPPAVRRRVLRLAALAAGASGVEAVHLHAADALVTDWHGQGAVSLPGGRVAARRYGRLYLGTQLDTGNVV
jgi:tRNA(Ile)-lysidine synthase